VRSRLAVSALGDTAGRTWGRLARIRPCVMRSALFVAVTDDLDIVAVRIEHEGGELFEQPLRVACLPAQAPPCPLPQAVLLSRTDQSLPLAGALTR